MRRAELQVFDSDRIDGVILSCHCCRLGFYDGEGVYIVPLNFGYERREGRQYFYFHSAPEGRKLACIQAGQPVGFELDTGYRLQEAPQACAYSAEFQSVIGTGAVTLLQTAEEKAHALGQIMAHYTGKTDWPFPREALDTTAVFRLEVTRLTCKIHP